MYKYEFHAHCRECSKCGFASAEEQVRQFHAAGYAGMVFTDHCCCGYTAVPPEWSWDKRVRFYYDTYLEAKRIGDELDFDVHFGWEHAYGNGKEALTYGIDLRFLLENPDIPDISIEEYCARVRAYGGYTAMAHPYRTRAYINEDVHPPIGCLDGVEVYNAANGPCENAKAVLLCVAHPELGWVSGSDSHRVNENVGRSGLAFERRLRTKEELVAALKAKEGLVIADGAIVHNIDEFLRTKP